MVCTTILSVACYCRSKLSMQHCMRYKKDGFISIRHSDLRNLATKILSEVCNDTGNEPKFTSLRVVEIKQQKNITNEAQFGKEYNKCFFDLKMLDSNAATVSRICCNNLT